MFWGKSGRFLKKIRPEQKSAGLEDKSLPVRGQTRDAAQLYEGTVEAIAGKEEHATLFYAIYVKLWRLSRHFGTNFCILA